MRDRPGDSPTRIHLFSRTARQTEALGAIAAGWQGKFWPVEDVKRAVERPGSLVVFAAEKEDDSRWDGVALADVGPYGADLLYLYVPEDRRRQGIAVALFDGMLDRLREKPQVEALRLEVRISNLAALSLYSLFGLAEIGRRANYYADGEDALILKYDLHLPGGSGADGASR